MALDLKIDPATRDYVDDGLGSWLETDDNSTAVLVQVESELNKWGGDPPAGSRVKEVLRAEVPTAEDVEDALTVAMNVLVRAGLISNLTIEAVEVDTGVEAFLLNWLDRHTSKPGDLSYSPLGGNPVVP